LPRTSPDAFCATIVHGRTFSGRWRLPVA